MVKIIKKDGTIEDFNEEKIIKACKKAAVRTLHTLTNEEISKILSNVKQYCEDKDLIEIEKIHNIVELSLEKVNKKVANCYRAYRNYKIDFVKMLDNVYKESQRIMYIGDKENANSDSALVSTKRSLVFNQLNKELYKKFFLNKDELQAIKDGYIYIHDMSARRDCTNCCLADISTILSGGFEMGNIWYNEPKTLDVAFDVIGDITLSMASQQYGGFTLPEVDKILLPYINKSYDIYLKKYRELGLDEEKSKDQALKDIEKDLRQGFQGWEYKFNTVASSRGDYPFITVTFGLGESEFEKLANKIILETRMNGQGKKDHKKPVLFPKLVFLYDKELHSEGKPLYDVFLKALDCSSACMYPDFLSLTGNGYISSMYKKYKKVISPMGCVEGKEVVTYKFNNNLYVESFDKFWFKMANIFGVKLQENNSDLYIEPKNLKIYDTVNGLVNVKYLIRNTQNEWALVKTENRTLTCTLDHPFHTSRGRVLAKDLNENDLITVSNKQYTENENNISIDEAWLYGLFLNNGYYLNKEIYILVNDTYKEEHLDILKQCSKIVLKSDIIINDIVMRNKKYKKIIFDIKDSNKLSNTIFMLKTLFNGSNKKNRHIPSIIFNSNKEIRKSFLSGFVSGISLNNKDDVNICYKTTNKELSLQLMMLCNSLNIMVKHDEIVRKYKKERLTLYVDEFKREPSNIEDYRNEKIVSIKKYTKTNYSYDVTTETDHFDVSGIYSHNCRAFLSPWYEKGGMKPLDENDSPVFVGRFNIGAISLHLPMILAKAREENKDFYEVLDYYLEMIRQLHIRTYEYLGEMRASINPLAFCFGGFYGGHLNFNDKIKPVLKSATASFGITALNELQELYNGKSLVEDGEFALEVMKYINKKINQFKEEDGNLYAIYGTPAESLCFSGDTLISTEFGLKEIKDLKIGDKVYSYNLESNTIELKGIIDWKLTEEHSVVHQIKLDNSQEIICTPKHPFAIIYNEDIVFKNANELKEDDKLINMSDTGEIYFNTIISNKVMDKLVPVYDITVEDNHTYFIGSKSNNLLGILVHNCGLQINQFVKKYGVIEHVSDRPYVSNSFHCHVSENITPIEKQDYEERFWELLNGGKIQYVRYPINYNKEAIKTLVERAMDKGFYEGVNLSLSYCDDCGHEELEMDICPKCGSKNLTKIDRMNGYLAYSRVHGNTRLNEAKMAEIAERRSM